MLDYAPGGSFGTAMTATSTHVYTAGSMAHSIKLENHATGTSVEGKDEGADRDVFIAKVGPPREVT